MRAANSQRFTTLLACGALAVFNVLSGDEPRREVGLPHFTAINPRDYQGHTQVWSAVEDRAGLLYFGNYGRVLVYDGARWSHIEVPDTSFVRALAIDAEDTLWIGGVDELGYARTDANGARTFVSLKSQLPDAAQRCGEIWRTLATPRGALFQTNSWLLRWDGHQFATCALTGPGSWQAFAVGPDVWVTHAQRGWFRLVDNGDTLTLAPIPGAAHAQVGGVPFVLPGTPDGDWVLGTSRNGLVRWRDGTATPFATEVDELLKQNRLYRGTRLPDGRLVLATLQGGAFLLDPEGRLLARLNEEAGVPDNTCLNVFPDSHGALWLCLEKGLARVDGRPWLSWIGPASGAPRGTLGTPVRFHEQLLIPANTGLFRLVPAARGQVARLAPVPEWHEYVTGITLADDTLIAFGHQGLFAWDGTRATSLPGDTPNAFSFTASRAQPGRWFALVDGALRTFHRDNGAWIDEGLVTSLPLVRSITEELDGTFWLGTPNEGVLRVRFPHASAVSPGEPEVRRYGVERGLPRGHGWARVTLVGDRPLLTCEKGFFRYDATADRFVATTEFGPQFADGTTTARTFVPDPAGGLWIAARPAGQAELVTTLQIGLADTRGWHPLRLPQLELLDDIQAMHVEPDASVLWLAGHGGLVRVDLTRWRETPAPPPPVVSLRAAATARGEPLPLAAGWALPFDRRVLHLEFAAPALAGDDAAEFETTLLGESTPLVQLSSAPQREFAALAPGHYTLRVRARGTEGVWSAPREIAFTVLPPWWRGPWAWAGYALLSVASVAGFVAYRTRTLHRRAEQLEVAIAARTEELRRSNAELARLHRLELDEKTAARLAEEKARLEVLRYQLNPHFLFNALTSVCAQLPPSLPGARLIIERLTDFCQATLFRDEHNEHPLLADELRLLTTYLEIEKVRWGSALSVEVEIDPATQSARIPSLLLLPLVENALKYGQQNSAGSLGVRLRAVAARDAALVIEVANTGRWITADTRGSRPSLGIGLENLRQRLERYYPGEHELATVEAEGWVIVRLRLRQFMPRTLVDSSGIAR